MQRRWYFAFLRESEGKRFWVVLNFSGSAHEVAFELPALEVKYYRGKTGRIEPNFVVAPWEILICVVGI